MGFCEKAFNVCGSTSAERVMAFVGVSEKVHH
jgi:hypothetical protein